MNLQKIIEELVERLDCLEVTVSATESEPAVVWHVNTFILRQLDEAGTYASVL